MEKILEVNNLNKSFGKKQILKNVSFEMNSGEILGFIGPNGAGKTTTIKLILGLQSIDSGKVLINNFDITKDYEKAIEKVGAIVESPDLYMYLTGRKNLEMIARLYKGITKERIEEVIKITGLENRIDDKVSKYSLGMRQRLGIAAAIINKPNMLILDEPTNGLDPEGIKDLRNLLKKLAKEEKMAILISSHNLAELESFCTNVCLIKNGEIIDSGSVKSFKQTKKTKYSIEISSTKKLKKIKQEYEIIDDTHFNIIIDKEEIPSLIKELIENGIDIYEVKLIEMTLEEAFLSKAGGNIID